MGYRNTVCLGLLASIVALLLTPSVPQSYWVLGSLVTGLGYGLRWIGNETWLFGIVSDQTRGRIVGLHESLLGIAAIAGPALVALLGADGFPSFVTAAAFTAAAAFPLMLASLYSSPPTMEAHPSKSLLSAVAATIAGIMRTGPLTAGIGGVIESALISMFPVFASERGIGAGNIAWLLSIFGFGAMLLQLPIGWLADRRGVRVASMIVAALTVLCALAIEVLEPLSMMMLGVLIFVLGGTITGFLTLGIVAAAMQATRGQLAAEMSMVSITFTITSVAGPLVAGALFTLFGGASLLALIELSAAVLLLLLARR
jgi:MFS family permease